MTDFAWTVVCAAAVVVAFVTRDILLRWRRESQAAWVRELSAEVDKRFEEAEKVAEARAVALKKNDEDLHEQISRLRTQAAFGAQRRG